LGKQDQSHDLALESNKEVKSTRVVRPASPTAIWATKKAKKTQECSRKIEVGDRRRWVFKL